MCKCFIQLLFCCLIWFLTVDYLKPDVAYTKQVTLSDLGDTMGAKEDPPDPFDDISEIQHESQVKHYIFREPFLYHVIIYHDRALCIKSHVWSLFSVLSCLSFKSDKSFFCLSFSFFFYLWSFLVIFVTFF